jgi:hypothetical protein
MRVVDHHVEMLKKVLAEDAANVAVYGTEIQEAKHEGFLTGDGVGAGLQQVEMSDRGRFMESCTRNRDRALGAEVKLVGQGGTDDGCIGASVQKEVVGAGMVDEYGQDNLVAVHEAEGYTGDISRAMGFSRQRRDEGCCEKKGSEPP